MSKFATLTSALPDITLSHALRPLFIILLLLAHPVAGLAVDWSQCSAPTITRNDNSASEVTRIEADHLSSKDQRLYQFDGAVELFSGERILRADSMRMDRQSRLFFAHGNLQYEDPQFRLNAQAVELNDAQNSARFEQADFQLFENHLRGSATSILQLNADQSELHDVSYTSCDPGQNSWSLNAGKLLLDQRDGRGTAHHAVLKIRDVPVFYFPWFQFPIDDRRMSGLLTPTLSHSGLGGYQLSLPLYWNIAANADMTFTPVFYSLRGTQLNSENRYLFGSAAMTQSGQLDLSQLDDKVTQSERYFARWTHQAKLGEKTRASILLQKMSDEFFFSDFDYPGDEDIDFLPSTLTLDSELAHWSTRLLLEQHQILNELKPISARPYKRLPSLSIDRLFSVTGSTFSVDWKNQWTRFERDQSLTGQRLHVAPTLAWPIEQNGYYFKPELQLDFTRYALLEADQTRRDEQRSIALLSLDGGLIFERLASARQGWFQTFEPRLYLLYVPYQDQSALPDFDTSLLPENYNNLFISNRFSGADRIGDSKQLSLGLTTRLLDKNNREVFSASLGQAFYAQARKVSLDNSVDERKKSSLMALISAQPHPRWKLQLASVYDQQIKKSIQNDLSIRHRAGATVFNMEYHYRREKLEQTTVSLVYPLSRNWNVFAKRQHSLLKDLPVQNLFGLAYESCCWGFKLLYEDSTDKNFENRDQTLFFQLTLKGLSSAGKDVNSQLENAILGYQPLF